MTSPYRIFHCDIKLNITNIGKSIFEKKLNTANVPQIILERSNHTIEIIEPPQLEYGNTFISSELTITYKVKVDLLKTICENNKLGTLFGYLASTVLTLFGKRSYAIGRQLCIQMAEGFKSKIGLLDSAVVSFKKCTVYKLNDHRKKIQLYAVEND